LRIGIADLKLEAGLHKTVPLVFTMQPVEMGGLLFHFDQPITGDAEIWNTGDELLVRARVKGETLVECSRCLTPFTLPIQARFEEEFVEGDPKADDDDDDLLTDDRTVTHFLGDAIDLSDAIRENVLLELPMKPLCSEDCKGLCPTCGANLNDGPCTCTEAIEIDPRLAAFKDLLRKPDSNP